MEADARDFFTSISTAELTSTLVAIKRRMRQLVHCVNELAASPEQTKLGLELLWRMITFLAPYVASLDDPSGEMRVVVVDIKNTFEWVKQAATGFESRARKLIREATVARIVRPGVGTAAVPELNYMTATPVEIRAHFSRFEACERELTRLEFEQRYWRSRGVERPESARSPSVSPVMARPPPFSSSSSSLSAPSVSISNSSVSPVPISMGNGPASVAAKNGRSGSNAGRSLSRVSGNGTTSVSSSSLTTSSLGGSGQSFASLTSSPVLKRVPSAAVSFGTHRQLQRAETRARSWMAVLQENGSSATFDFGVAQLEELVAQLQLSATDGSLSMVASRGRPEGHYQLLAHRKPVGWAVRDLQSNEFTFFDLARTKTLLKLVGRQDDVVGLLSPIMSPLSSPRMTLVEMDDVEDDEEADEDDAGDPIGMGMTSGAPRGLGGGGNPLMAAMQAPTKPLPQTPVIARPPSGDINSAAVPPNRRTVLMRKVESSPPRGRPPSLPSLTDEGE